MILRSRADGVVVKRNVVKGNYYTSADHLMTIAPLDHLWVRGSVSELDAEKVEVGQKLKVIFPFSDRTIDAKVDYIDKAIDPERGPPSSAPRSPTPRAGSRPACSCGCCSRSRPSRADRHPPRRPWSRSTGSTTSSSEAGEDRPVRAAPDLRGQGKQRHRHRRRARRRPPRAHARRGGRDDRQPDPRADVRGRVMAEGGLLVSEPAQEKARSTSTGRRRRSSTTPLIEIPATTRPTRSAQRRRLRRSREAVRPSARRLARPRPTRSAACRTV